MAHYTYGANNELVSITRGGKTYYCQTNYRGDVTALTDSTGAVVASYEYDAFGNLLKETGTVENTYRYAGYRYDEVTGLYYLQSRYYNPETGRFLTRNSFEGFEDEPQSLNKYSYVHNNPILYVDPNGNHPVIAVALMIIRFSAPLLRKYGMKAARKVINYSARLLKHYKKNYLVTKKGKKQIKEEKYFTITLKIPQYTRSIPKGY
ncbi:cell wall-associated protein, partial [Desmospora sp. 8437]